MKQSTEIALCIYMVLSFMSFVEPKGLVGRVAVGVIVVLGVCCLVNAMDGKEK